MNLRWCRLLMASLCCTVNGTSLEGSQRAASLASPILLAYHWCVTSRTVIGTAAGATADLTLQCRCVGPVDETFMYFSTMWHLWGMTLVTGLSCIPGSELECVTETKCKLATHLREFLTTDGSHSKSVIVFGNRLDLPGFLQDFSPNSDLDLKTFL